MEKELVNVSSFRVVDLIENGLPAVHKLSQFVKLFIEEIVLIFLVVHGLQSQKSLQLLLQFGVGLFDGEVLYGHIDNERSDFECFLSYFFIHQVETIPVLQQFLVLKVFLQYFNQVVELNI
jgi:hypothetical protein